MKKLSRMCNARLAIDRSKAGIKTLSSIGRAAQCIRSNSEHPEALPKSAHGARSVHGTDEAGVLAGGLL
jgi:hypothetical protein